MGLGWKINQKPTATSKQKTIKSKHVMSKNIFLSLPESTTFVWELIGPYFIKWCSRTILKLDEQVLECSVPLKGDLIENSCLINIGWITRSFLSPAAWSSSVRVPVRCSVGHKPMHTLPLLCDDPHRSNGSLNGIMTSEICASLVPRPWPNIISDGRAPHFYRSLIMLPAIQHPCQSEPLIRPHLTSPSPCPSWL